MAKSQSNFIQSVDRALQILECFSKKNTELGVSQITNLLGLHKSTTFGLMATLENRGYLKQNTENSKYRLGMKLFELGKTVEDDMNLKESSHHYLKELVDKYQETAHLAVLDGNEILYIDKVEGEQAIRMNSQVGKRRPLYCTGVGKAILAFMSEDKVARILSNIDFCKYTSHTITELQGLQEELCNIRKEGYCIDDEEIEVGLNCVAAPIIDFNGEAIASISIAGPTIRMTQKKSNFIAKDIKEIAAKISETLGYKKLLP